MLYEDNDDDINPMLIDDIEPIEQKQVESSEQN